MNIFLVAILFWPLLDFFDKAAYNSHQQIKDRIDSEQAAVCPKCKIDSLLADSVVDWDRDFLNKVNKYWF